MLTTAPTSIPPALAPYANTRLGSANPCAANASVTAMKSVKELRLFSNRPLSYQRRPISRPPRTCAMA